MVQEKNRLSIKEIAKLADVSVATVSRVINNNGRFSKETRDRVQAVIDEYGYTTNMAAKSLRMSKSKSIGLIVTTLDNEFFAHLILEIENYFFKKNYSVFICNTSQNQEKEMAYFKSLDAKLVDGIICISGFEEIPSHLITRNIPIVCIDRKPRNHQDVYYVESNHYSGGYLATEELIKQGCKKIAIIAKPEFLSVNKQRLDGYRQALKDYGIERNPDLELYIDESYGNVEGARRAMNSLIQSGIEFDGVFGTNDWRAYGALNALKENNCKVPDDVKLIGFDDIYIAQASYPSMSTIKQNVPGLAITASSLLLNLMNEVDIGDDDEKHYILPVQVIRRNSTQNTIDE